VGGGCGELLALSSSVRVLGGRLGFGCREFKGKVGTFLRHSDVRTLFYLTVFTLVYCMYTVAFCQRSYKRK